MKMLYLSISISILMMSSLVVQYTSAANGVIKIQIEDYDANIKKATIFVNDTLKFKCTSNCGLIHFRMHSMEEGGRQLSTLRRTDVHLKINSLEKLGQAMYLFDISDEDGKQTDCLNNSESVNTENIFSELTFKPISEGHFFFYCENEVPAITAGRDYIYSEVVEVLVKLNDTIRPSTSTSSTPSSSSSFHNTSSTAETSISSFQDTTITVRSKENAQQRTSVCNQIITSTSIIVSISTTVGSYQPCSTTTITVTRPPITEELEKSSKPTNGSDHFNILLIIFSTAVGILLLLLMSTIVFIIIIGYKLHRTRQLLARPHIAGSNVLANEYTNNDKNQL